MRTKPIPDFPADQLGDFWSFVETSTDGCWRWSGHVDRDGHAVWFSDQNGSFMAKRVAWTLINGPIPPRRVLTHCSDGRCHDKACINPDHYEAVTRSTAISRARRQAVSR